MMRAEEFQALNEEIAGLARAGLPLDQGLDALSRDLGSGKLARVTGQLAEALRQGKSLAEAFGEQKGTVPPYYSALLSSGIRTGRMADVLSTITLHARTLSELRTTLWLSVAYPVFILACAFLLIGLMAIYLIPRFSEIFQSFGMKVPLVTTFLLWVGEEPWTHAILPMGLILGVLGLLLFQIWAGGSGSRFLTGLIYSVPMVGSLVQGVRLSVFCDLMGILLENQVPFPEALRLAGTSSSDPILREASEQAAKRMESGAPIHEVLKNQIGFPRMLSWMAGWSERKGELPQSFRHAAQFFQRRAEAQSILLRSILPTVCILLIGGLVALLVIGGLMAPLIMLLEGLSK